MRNTEAALPLIGLQMAQGDGEGIGNVGGFGKFLQAKLRADHQLHLAFIGLAVAGDTCFNLAWRIAVDVKSMFFGGKEDNAAYLGQTQGGSNV
jgi:hypothetical protein